MRRSSTAALRSPTVAILGAGITGLTAAAFLRKQGIEDFTVFEENGDGVGGTWRDHVHDYPGAGTRERCRWAVRSRISRRTISLRAV